jgi:hypothetical protein
MVGTEFPFESYAHCMDSADTPKTLALERKYYHEINICCQLNEIYKIARSMVQIGFPEGINGN